MKTLPDIITKDRKDPVWVLYFRRFMDDFWCFFLGHNWQGFSGAGERFTDWDWVCRRCYRRQQTGGFHHNWEMDRGPAARCHDHSNKKIVNKGMDIGPPKPPFSGPNYQE